MNSYSFNGLNHEPLSIVDIKQPSRLIFKKSGCKIFAVNAEKPEITNRLFGEYKKNGGIKTSEDSNIALVNILKTKYEIKLCGNTKLFCFRNFKFLRCFSQNVFTFTPGPADAILVCSEEFYKYIDPIEMEIDLLKSDNFETWRRNMFCRVMMKMGSFMDKKSFFFFSIGNGDNIFGNEASSSISVQ